MVGNVAGKTITEGFLALAFRALSFVDPVDFAPPIRNGRGASC